MRQARKSPKDRNVHATLDRAIGTLRQTLARVLVAKRTEDWADALPGVVRGLNRTPHSSLPGDVAPDDVEGNKVVQFFLMWRAGEVLQRNARLIEARGKRLLRDGAFRVELPQPKHFGRAYKPRYSDTVHLVARVEGAQVVDAEGRSFATRHVLPVPAGTRALSAETSTRARGSALVDRRRLEGLEPYREALVDFLGTEARTIRATTSFMKDQGVALPVGMSYVGALRLLGFVVTIPPSGGGGTVRNPKAPPKAAAPAPPAVPKTAAAPPVAAAKAAPARPQVPGGGRGLLSFLAASRGAK